MHCPFSTRFPLVGHDSSPSFVMHPRLAADPFISLLFNSCRSYGIGLSSFRFSSFASLIFMTLIVLPPTASLILELQAPDRHVNSPSFFLTPPMPPGTTPFFPVRARGFALRCFLSFALSPLPSSLASCATPLSAMCVFYHSFPASLADSAFAGSVVPVIGDLSCGSPCSPFLITTSTLALPGPSFGSYRPPV